MSDNFGRGQPGFPRSDQVKVRLEAYLEGLKYLSTLSKISSGRTLARHELMLSESDFFFWSYVSILSRPKLDFEAPDCLS